MPSRDLRIYFHILNERRRRARQLHAADDTVPGRLGLIRHAVSIDAEVDEHAVVHSDREGMFARFHHGRKVVDVRHTHRIATAHGFAVDPEARLPVISLQKE